MRQDVRVHGKRLRETYSQMMSSLPNRFKSTDEQVKIVALLPAYDEMRCQLTRHRTHSCIPVPDPRSIPEEFRTTLRGREAADGDQTSTKDFFYILDKKVRPKCRYFLKIPLLEICHRVGGAGIPPYIPLLIEDKVVLVFFSIRW